MKINLIWVGKTKEQFIRDGIDKYMRMLAPYADIEITLVKEEKGSNSEMIVKRESERILGLKVPYVLMDERGEKMTSAKFADGIAKTSRHNLLIGGAYGVSEEVKARASGAIALSGMTFTHEMARLFLVEQLYRAFSIINRKGYHH